MTPETALPGTTSGERRRAATGSAPARVWDPDGPSGGAIAPALVGRAARRGAVGPGRVGTRGRARRGDGRGRRPIWRSSAPPSASRPAARTPTSPRCPATRSRAACVGLVRAAFLERAQALPAARCRPAPAHAGRAGAGGPAARGGLVAALRRPALRARRPRARRRGGPRPPLPAHLDPVPRRDPAAGPERRR